MFDVRDVKVRDVVGVAYQHILDFFGDTHHMFPSNISSLITPHSVCVVNILAAANTN